MQDLDQSQVCRSHFPALQLFFFAVWVLIGSLRSFIMLLLANVISLVWFFNRQYETLYVGTEKATWTL